MLKINSTNRVGCLLATGLALSVSGCATLHDFAMGASNEQMRNIQTLDLDAATRNEGMVISLNGKYGRNTMLSYQKSNSAPKSARGKISTGKIGK